MSIDNPEQPEASNSGRASETEAQAGFRLSSRPVVQSKPGEDAHKFETTLTGEGIETPDYENLGDLPQTYGSQAIYLVARDPRWLFAYWDIDWTTIFENAGPKNHKIHLRVYKSEGEEESDTEIDPMAGNWYLPVSHPGSQYYVDLGYYNTGGEWKGIARSGLAVTPSDKVAEQAVPEFASVPFHLSFQRLMDIFHAAMAEGETLMQALARLQRKAWALGISMPALAEWVDQLAGASTISPDGLSQRMGVSSSDMEAFLRKDLGESLSSGLAEKLGSAAGSELSSQGRLQELLGAGAGSELSSQGRLQELLSVGGGSELSSQALLAELFASSENLSSGVGANWSGLMEKWGELLSASSEVGAFWSGLAEQWKELSAGGSFVGSSWGEFGSSGNSLGGLGSGGSSSEIGASWSAQPFSEPRSSGDFSLNLAGEVIFYGSTHPDAKLMIDGKPVSLRPDGTFHHHLVFPNENYEISIVAKSSDGSQDRAGTLSFRPQAG